MIKQFLGGDRWYKLPGTVPLHGYHDESGLILLDERPGHEFESTFLIDADDDEQRLWHATVQQNVAVGGKDELVNLAVHDRVSEYVAADLVAVSAPKWADEPFQALSTGWLK